MAFVVDNSMVLEIRIHGYTWTDGQAIENRWHVRANNVLADGWTSSDVLAAFDAQFWLGRIVPLMNVEYALADYTLLRVASATMLIPTPRSPHPYKLNYDMQDILVPAATERGGITTEALPSYAAVSMRKVATTVGGSFKGGTRISPISETDTLPAGNQLVPARWGVWAGALGIIPSGLTVAAGAHPNPMNIDFLILAGKILAWGAGPPTPIACTSFIAGIQLHENLGSQVSRKVPVTGS